MHEVDLAIFRNNLKVLRSVHRLSARELAVKADLRQLKRISDFEDGRGKPSLDELYSICITLNVSLDEILNKELRITYQ
ncbi:MAG TPA: helix-turn-helix transcriptional regulator [Nitrososphaeraceae archaeon]|nr:helix-turn-helix transcriptional regulator [Nitrososphaeraceae archaeon]